MDIAESHNGRSMVADSTRRRKGKAVAVKRDLDVEKVKKINELAETKTQFQHMMDYLCTTVGIPPPPPLQLYLENQADNLLRKKPIRIDNMLLYIF